LPEWIVKWFRSGMTLAALEAVAERIDDEKVALKLVSFATDIELVTRLVKRGKPTREVLAAIRGRVGLGEAMEQLDRSKSEGSSQLDDLEALEQVADLHPDPATFESWLRGLLTRERTRDGVTLASIHRVKGREWPAVVVYGASAGLLPHRLAESVEEERRVLHVGITRGREQVVVIADANRPSPFLAELTTRAPTPSAEPARLGAAAAARPVVKPSPQSGGSSSSKAAASPKGDETNPVFIALRTWRGEEARSVSMPPYVIFHDRTLHEIARARPTSTRELGAIGGVGPAKLEKYGAQVLAVVAAAEIPAASEEAAEL
jgi:DNA helicase II / ATP-dependent DNA helicase PcrA